MPYILMIVSLLFDVDIPLTTLKNDSVYKNIKLCKYAAIALVSLTVFFGCFASSARAWVASGTPLSYSSFAAGIKYATQIAIDSSGNVYQSGYEGCCTVGNKGVAKYDSAGTYLTKFGPVDPTGVGVDNDGNILVMDYQQNFVKKFTNTGTPIDISSTDMGSYAYQAPYTVAIDSTGNVYVADIFLNRVIKFNSSYAFDSNITGNSGAFSSPQGVSVDGSDNVYVLDSGNNRVQKFNSSGTWQLTITGHGSAFNYPEAMTVDTNGNIYVADSGNNRIQIFDTNGVFLQEITSADVNTGTGSPISYLSGMGFQNPNTLFVGDNTRSFKIIFDHDDPSVIINALAGNNTTSNTPTFTGTTSDTTTVITNVEYSIDSGSYSSCAADDGLFDEISETYSCTVSPALDAGAHTIDVRGTDSKNNSKITNYAFTATLPAADTYTYGWTKAFQGNSYEFGYSVKTDDLGNIYTTGSFDSTVDFDPGTSVDNHTAVGSSDIFLTKYNADGSYGWTKTWGGNSTDNGNGVSTDSSGNVYVTGYFSNTVDFNTGAPVENHTSVGSYDIFLTKINSDGSYGWTKTVGGSSVDIGNSVTIDVAGNILVAGYYSSSFDFDPSAGTDTQSFAGTSDIFFSKYNSDGSYSWTKTLGGVGAENATSVTTDSTGIVYITGYFESTTDFNPEAGTDNRSPAGGRDIFLSKYNADGTYSWTKTMGASGFDFSNSVTTDSSNNIFITGPFDSTVDFDPGAGVDNHTSSSGYDLFITKINSDGTYGWTKTVGGSGTDYGTSITSDSSGNIYATGFFSSTVDFKPGAGVDNRTSAGSDLYITSYTNNGTYRWVHTATSDSGTDGYAITYDLTKNSVYATGDFGIVVDFNPLGGNDIITTDSNWSGWIMKLGAVDPSLITSSPSPSSSPSVSNVSSVLGTSTVSTNTSCSILPPDSAPDIFKITRTGDKATIFYAPISSNVTKYQLMYGYKAGDERFATSFDADSSGGALKFEVSDLVPTQTYVFWMKGMNDCAPGPSSNNYTTHGIVLSPDTSETKNSNSGASAASNLTPWSGMTPGNSSNPSSASETNGPLTIQLTLVDLLGMPLSKVPFDITVSHDSVAHVATTTTNKDGKATVSLNPGDYTITTSYNDSSYSKVVKILPRTDSLTVRFPTPLRDAFLRQVYAPIDASYGVKAGIGVVSLGWITTSLFSFLVVSRTILASLATVYRNSSRSILRLPIDYIANLMRFSSLGFAARIAPIMPSLGKKKKSNGLVFDAYTFKPIAKAFVVLFSKSGNLKTDYTDLHGRYSFDSVAPDEYQMRSEISGYKFPSSIITTPQTLGMDHVYMQGETIPVTDENSYLDEIALAMDPADKSGIISRVFHFATSGLITIYRKLSIPLAGLGLTTVAYATATNPSQFNQAVAIICGIYTFSSLSLRSRVKKMSGRVLDFARNPISEAHIKLFKINQNGETGSLYTSTKTDKHGRYFLQPEIGNYILEMTTNAGEKITQTLRIMKNVPSVDKDIIAAGA